MLKLQVDKSNKENNFTSKSRTTRCEIDMKLDDYKKVFF